VTSLRIEVPTRDAASLEVVPDLDAARGLAGAYGHVPLTHTYVADCETPVSAFLKLRDGGPAFLLESAEQGQRVGRYSMLGVQPRAVLTARGETLREVRADGTGGDLDPTDPFGAVERAVAALAMAPASMLAQDHRAVSPWWRRPDGRLRRRRRRDRRPQAADRGSRP